MMTIQDLETAVREKIPVKVVVNDNSYRVLYFRQRLQKEEGFMVLCTATWILQGSQRFLVLKGLLFRQMERLIMR